MESDSPSHPIGCNEDGFDRAQGSRTDGRQISLSRWRLVTVASDSEPRVSVTLGYITPGVFRGSHFPRLHRVGSVLQFVANIHLRPECLSRCVGEKGHTGMSR